jgi:hypothetical protein
MRKIKSNRTCDNFIFSSDLNSGDLESKQKEWFQKKCRSSEVVLVLECETFYVGWGLHFFKTNSLFVLKM